MAATASKTYGPKDPSEELLRREYRIPTKNDDDIVTQDTVDGWVKNFEQLSDTFRADHSDLLKKIASE